MSVQTSAQDHTKGPVGLSGTVVECHLVPPRIAGDQVPLVITIICGDIRCHITKVYDTQAEAKEVMRRLPVGSHLSAFGEAPNLRMRNGELHLATQRVITYSLVTDFTQRNLFQTIP